MSDARAPTKAQGIYEDVTHILPHVLKKILFATFFEKSISIDAELKVEQHIYNAKLNS